jgi:biopolymer transport protein ExbD
MKFKKHTPIEPEINLIAFIDVLLVILIFLMLTTQFSQSSQLQINLPKAKTQSQSKPNPSEDLQLQISPQGRFVLQGQWIAGPKENAQSQSVPSLNESVDSVSAALLKASQSLESPTLIINADQATPHQWVIAAMEAAQRAHFSRVAFAIQNTAPLSQALNTSKPQ